MKAVVFHEPETMQEDHIPDAPCKQIYHEGLRLKFGQVFVHNYIDDLIKWVEENQFVVDDITPITCR